MILILIEGEGQHTPISNEAVHHLYRAVNKFALVLIYKLNYQYYSHKVDSLSLSPSLPLSHTGLPSLLGSLGATSSSKFNYQL
jgi:hypothetical protein